MNKRILQVNAATEAESLAPRTVINWNPIDNAGQVSFECAKYYRDAGTTRYFAAPEADGSIVIDLDPLLQRSVTVQTENGPVVLPTSLLMAAVKVLFDELYNEIR